MADAAAKKSTMYPVVMAAADAPLIPGRRDWVVYRDLGLTEASGGLLSMHTTDVDTPLFRETVPIEVPEIWRGFDASEHEPTE